MTDYQTSDACCKYTLPDVRVSICKWFINMRSSLKGSLTRNLYKIMSQSDYETWLAQQEGPPKEHSVCGWMCESGVSLRKPNKRYQIKLEDRVELIQECDCNWIRTHNHLVHKRTLNDLAKLARRVREMTRTYS